MRGAATARREATTLRGVVERIFFKSPDFSAGRLRAADGSIASFAGPVMVREQDRVVFTGAWGRHKKYGRQFKVTGLLHDLPLDPEGLANYLANHPDVSGIGPARAKAIAQAFGADFEEVLLSDPERIARVARIPLEVIDNLADVWERTRAVNAAMTWLAAYGLTHHQVTTLVDKYANNVIAILKEDPYLIAGAISGFGFKRIDLVARKLGTPKDAPGRLRAGVLHCVTRSVDDGDCWIEFEDLVDRANALLVLDTLDARERIEATLNELLDQKKLAWFPLGQRFLIARPSLYEMECKLASALSDGRAPNPHFEGPGDLESELAHLEPDLNGDQRAAVLAAAHHRQCVISGSAGSGKTYTIAALVRTYERRGCKVLLAAPTGKAAKRLEQVVGHPAVTIHRMLEYNGRDFERSHRNPLTADVVIIDEVSMLDVPLAWHLYDALRLSQTALVLVGDHNQLPPVGPGNLLRDLIDRRPLRTIILRDVVRQAGALKESSLAVLDGEVRKTARKMPCGRRPWYVADQFSDALAAQRFILELFEDVLVDRLGFDLLADVQLLTPQKKGPLGVRALNVLLQRLVQRKLWDVQAPDVPENGKPAFLLNDRVIQTRNDYDRGVMNGAIGIVTKVGPQRGDLCVTFDSGVVRFTAEGGEAKYLQLAYALTIHKAQGSEFPCAVVVIHKAHSFMHHRNLFYTAVTRAQEVAIVVGDRWGQRNCAEKEQVERRKTFLSVLDLPAPLPGNETPAA